MGEGLLDSLGLQGVILALAAVAFFLASQFLPRGKKSAEGVARPASAPLGASTSGSGSPTSKHKAKKPKAAKEAPKAEAAQVPEGTPQPSASTSPQPAAEAAPVPEVAQAGIPNEDLLFTFPGGDFRGASFVDLHSPPHSFNTPLGGAISVSFTARWDALPPWSRIIDFGSGPGADNIVISNYERGKTIVADIYRGTSRKRILMQGSIVIGQTSSYLFSVSASGHMKFMKDEVVIGELANGFVPRPVERSRLYVGGSNWSADGLFQGRIADLKIWRGTVEWNSAFPEKAEQAEVREESPKRAAQDDDSSPRVQKLLAKKAERKARRAKEKEEVDKLGEGELPDAAVTTQANLAAEKEVEVPRGKKEAKKDVKQDAPKESAAKKESESAAPSTKKKKGNDGVEAKTPHTSTLKQAAAAAPEAPSAKTEHDRVVPKQQSSPPLKPADQEPRAAPWRRQEQPTPALAAGQNPLADEAKSAEEPAKPAGKEESVKTSAKRWADHEPVKMSGHVAEDEQWPSTQRGIQKDKKTGSNKKKGATARQTQEKSWADIEIDMPETEQKGREAPQASAGQNAAEGAPRVDCEAKEAGKEEAEKNTNEDHSVLTSQVSVQGGKENNDTSAWDRRQNELEEAAAWDHTQEELAKQEPILAKESAPPASNRRKKKDQEVAAPEVAPSSPTTDVPEKVQYHRVPGMPPRRARDPSGKSANAAMKASPAPIVQRTQLDREILKQEKKLHEIEKLRQRLENGETLEPLQRDKIAKEEEVKQKVAELHLKRAVEQAEGLIAQQPAHMQAQQQQEQQQVPQQFGDVDALLPMGRTPLRPPPRGYESWKPGGAPEEPWVGDAWVSDSPESYGGPPKGKGKGRGRRKARNDQAAGPGDLWMESLEDMRGMQMEQQEDFDSMMPVMMMPVGGLPDGSMEGGEFDPSMMEGVPMMMPVEMPAEETWDTCWEWVRTGWCPRGATCRWDHPPLGTMVMPDSFLFWGGDEEGGEQPMQVPMESCEAVEDEMGMDGNDVLLQETVQS